MSNNSCLQTPSHNTCTGEYSILFDCPYYTIPNASIYRPHFYKLRSHSSPIEPESIRLSSYPLKHASLEVQILKRRPRNSKNTIRNPWTYPGHATVLDSMLISADNRKRNNLRCQHLHKTLWHISFTNSAVYCLSLQLTRNKNTTIR